MVDEYSCAVDGLLVVVGDVMWVSGKYNSC